MIYLHLMAKLPPKWLYRGYIILEKEFGNQEFTFQKASELLKEDERKINLLLAGLRNIGWLTSEKDHLDKRRAIYRLREIEDIHEELKKDVHVQARKQ